MLYGGAVSEIFGGGRDGRTEPTPSPRIDETTISHVGAGVEKRAGYGRVQSHDPTVQVMWSW